MERLLIANRGEVAVRIARAGAELGMATVAVYAKDDAASLHVHAADEAVALDGVGPRAYLDREAVLQVAQATGATLLHPGYGFLSEDAAFAEACGRSGCRFVGPQAETLALFGDKARARAHAVQCGVPLLPGTQQAVTLAGALAFFDSLPAGDGVVLKAVAGGGGRGIRVVRARADLEAAFERCQSEATAAFGRGDLYAERLLATARHVEVQVIADQHGQRMHLGERDCSLQRRHQKLVEVAPAPGLHPQLRERLLTASLTLADAANYESLGTFEFLVDTTLEPDAPLAFAFMEANPRLQVEHTVTEEVTGVDLVQAQLQIATGDRLSDLCLDPQAPPTARGFAVQVRVNLETLAEDGSLRPSGGTLTSFEPPSGPGLRVDTFGYAGYTTSGAYDSLLAKVIAHHPSPNPAAAFARAYRGLTEFRVTGVDTNLPFLLDLLSQAEVKAYAVHTGWLEAQLAALANSALIHPTRHGGNALSVEAGNGSEGVGQAGARIDGDDPLAVLTHGKQVRKPAEGGAVAAARHRGPAGTEQVTSPLQGTVVSLEVQLGSEVAAGQPLLVMEAMKMEHVIGAPCAGQVKLLQVRPGDAVMAGVDLLYIEPVAGDAAAEQVVVTVDLERIRPDLAELNARLNAGADASRPQAVEKRRKNGRRTARENLDDLCDEGSFVEYGALVIAAQRRRRSLEELIEKTPADGLVAGIGRVNGALFDDDRAQCAVLNYDYTVLAGTQGAQNHRKKDRLFEVAERLRLPVVFFTEGGGGRPGDTDGLGIAGLDTMAFHLFGKLSGWVPLVGVATGRCFAGNAALLGCCDVVIATEGSNIGMGGPAMIEGGGLGIFTPEEVGPLEVQVDNGVVDVAVKDEAEAVHVAKRYLSYFQGNLDTFECEDQRHLRHVIPENRLRMYDVRRVIDTLADRDSVLELRRGFGAGMVTALARIEGRSVGIVANNPAHLAGAIDVPAADKACRFMQLCDAFDLPILFLCDTPGIMVGPEVEKTGMVRHAARMFVTSASLDVPFCTLVTRKGYGLGAMAMAGGSFKASLLTAAWPTGEFGGMGLEGAIKLAMRKELAAIEDPGERKETFDKLVAHMYEQGKAVSAASHFEFDAVIDPADSRRWVLAALGPARPRTLGAPRKRPFVDPW